MGSSGNNGFISVKAIVDAPLDLVWKCWVSPSDIIQWNHASDDWHTTEAANDLSPGGNFNYRMESKDGKNGFDFWGTYNKVIEKEFISYVLGDGRTATVSFSESENKTMVVESFEAENTHSVEMQRKGWQAILDNFSKYTESQSKIS